MATRKMTFSIPVDLARRFMRQVPSRDRSRYLAAALERSLKRREIDLIRSCQKANEDPEVAAIEQELDAIGDAMEEPWNEPPPR